MHTAIIDRYDAVERFHALLDPGGSCRVMRLLGRAKMGKTLLVSKVFPTIARERFGAVVAGIDLRNSQQTVSDYLHIAHDLLGGDGAFPEYAAVYQKWLKHPCIEAEHLVALLSRISISARQGADDTRRYERQLSSAFVTDLRGLRPASIVFLFDTVDGAAEVVRTWLLDTFLVQTALLPHVRVVLSGRTIPEPSGAYAACCESFELLPVREDQEYIEFCRSQQFNLVDQSIRDFARAVRYVPGMFVDLVGTTFVAQGVRDVWIDS